MLSASRKLDYGILLMATLPEMGTQEFRSIQDIAREKELSAGFLSQLMMPLKKAGLVTAKEGVKGGYQLSRSSADITLEEIYTALEGPLQLTNCQNADKQCNCEKGCTTKGMWSELQSLMANYLKNKKLSELRNNSSFPIL